MSLLTVSGLLDTDINLLLILTPKFQLLTIYRLLKSISGLDLDHFTEELTDYEQYSFLLEKEEPAVYNSKEIPFIRKFGFTGSELLVLPSFELQGNKYAFMMARNTTRLFAPEEIELLNSFAELAKITIDNSFMFHQKANQERLEKEIEIAKDIQSNLLPRSMPISEEFDFGGFMIPAREIGGDYYDFLQSPDKKETIVAIGDVSGKGLPAGMVMATARTIIHSFVRRNPSLAEITRELNSYLYSNYINSVILRFMSMTILSIDHTQNKVEYIGAGHGNLLVYRHATKEVELIETGGTILGIIQDLPEEMYKMRPKLTINSNDIILLYTDGATETTNAAGEQFEESGMIELLKKYSEKSSKDLLIAIYEDLKKFAGSAPQHDDITLVSIKKL
jgi:serine phosphatase RsbU (regulator of sigma subunit)